LARNFFILVGIEQVPAQNNANESFESKFVDVGNVKLQYLDFEGEGLPILFIHNLFQGKSTGRTLLPALPIFTAYLQFRTADLKNPEENGLVENHVQDILT
jgi:hypothetical protein